ncbi:unnamed protein product [Linum tenue]|uniref:F-box domain-containing protein n=1 Tax=Linum tenue TaxID=586396 RepID=A0AAV0IDS8_9ROSI|nr:unnamed protein product [Linum tenue]
MEEGSNGAGGGGGESSSSRTTPSYVKLGDRQIFTVELRPGETTFVSWKKLVKDANKNCSGSAPVPDPPPPANAHPNLESRIAPGQGADNEENDDTHPHRFSAVIEKIERLYMGKDSSDDEDMKDAPDDDQYDTEDSFIDDAELDEYFEVDNSAIKHDGFFVNRGKLERISEPAAIPNLQPKKRRRKDLNKAPGDSGNVNVSNKHAKIGKSTAGKTVQSLGMNSSSPSQDLVKSGGYNEDVKPLNLSGTSSKKKSGEAKLCLDPSSTTKMSNGKASMAEDKNFQMQKPGSHQAKNFSSKSKDASGSSDASHLIHQIQDKSAYGQNKLQSGKPFNNVEEPESSVQSKERNGFRILPDLNSAPDGKMTVHKTASTVHKRDGSSVRPKGSMLEKAIKELERMVAECKPRKNVNGFNKSPHEYPGSLNTAPDAEGLSAMQEKDDRFQMIKKEVAEMIKTRVPSSESKAIEHQAGSSDDFQDLNSDNKGVVKRKFGMDAVLEDKVCDLYDLFVDLVGLWPSGAMDNHGIKRAICRAKDRRRAIYSRNKEEEKIRRKKIMQARPEEPDRADPSTAFQAQTQQHLRERSTSNTGGGPVLALASKPMSGQMLITQGTSSSILGSAHNLERPKQDRAKGSVSMEEVKMEFAVGEGVSVKKKVKRKPEAELDQTHFRSEKTYLQSSDERHKSVKPAPVVSQKLSLQSAVLPEEEEGGRVGLETIASDSVSTGHEKEEDEESIGVDWISELPDGILVSILSLLKLKDAAKTSSLSSRWVNLWKSAVTELDFDASELLELVNYDEDLMPRRRIEFREWVSGVVRQLTDASSASKKLTKFRISFALTNRCNSDGDIDRWLKFAISKRTESLELSFDTPLLDSSCDGENYVFPEDCFSYIKTPAGLSDIKSLRSIRLSYVEVKGETLEHFILNCPYLEDLAVHDSKLIVNLRIASGSSSPLPLKHLEVRGCDNLESLEVDNVPCLSHFKYQGHPPVELRLENCVSLVDVYVGFAGYEPGLPFHSISQYAAQLAALTMNITTNCICFSNVADFTRLELLKVEISGRFDDTVIGLVTLINACPRLRTLRVLMMTYYCTDEWCGGMLKPRVDRVVRESIKTVEIIGFKGYPIDCEFMEYVLECFTGMERILVDHGSEKRANEARKRALEFQSRVSPSIDFVII